MARCAFGEGGGENGCLDIVVVVDFRGLLAGKGAQNAAGGLDESSLEGDRSDEEQGVQCWAIAALADEVAGRDDEERWTSGGGEEPLSRGGPLACAHSASQDDCFKSAVGETGGEVVDVSRALGQHQAVAPAAVGFDDVRNDLPVACFVGG